MIREGGRNGVVDFFGVRTDVGATWLGLGTVEDAGEGTTVEGTMGTTCGEGKIGSVFRCVEGEGVRCAMSSAVLGLELVQEQEDGGVQEGGTGATAGGGCSSG